ncbi:MAG: 6-bladed beta-propeller, partial [Bacteroidales bacterium]|nr:6-bladed beta-propeller [Bacteroidales bacterium]
MKLISLRGLYSSLFLWSLLISCKSVVNNQPGTTPVIDLASSVGGGRVVNLSDIATDVRYVKLETSDSSLIGMFPRVFYENERIYVLSVRVIKVFDKNGKFLFKFDRRGRGAQEYQMASDTRVMSKTGEIIVRSNAPAQSNYLLFYDREGSFTKKIVIPY